MPPWLTDQVIQLKTTCWWMVEFTRTSMSKRGSNFEFSPCKVPAVIFVEDWRLKLTPELAPVATITYSHEGRELSCQLITDMAGLTLERDVGLKAYSRTTWCGGCGGRCRRHRRVIGWYARSCSFSHLLMDLLPEPLSPSSSSGSMWFLSRCAPDFPPCDLPWFSAGWCEYAYDSGFDVT